MSLALVAVCAAALAAVALTAALIVRGRQRAAERAWRAENVARIAAEDRAQRVASLVQHYRDAAEASDIVLATFAAKALATVCDLDPDGTATDPATLRLIDARLHEYDVTRKREQVRRRIVARIDALARSRALIPDALADQASEYGVNVPAVIRAAVEATS